MALTASDIDTSKTSQHTARLDKIGMALEALRNVIKGNPGLFLCYCYFTSLFSPNGTIWFYRLSNFRQSNSSSTDYSIT